jgi:hypothetical protein
MSLSDLMFGSLTKYHGSVFFGRCPLPELKNMYEILDVAYLLVFE